MGNLNLTVFLVLLIAAVLGFMVLNFPLGKIFLGDGGAYALGHLLVWSAILLFNNGADVSAFAILLISFGLLLTLAWQFGVVGN